MTETTLRLEGDDKNGIYGKLRANGNDRLIIHLHGMTHSMGHMLEVTSADFFETKGFDHYRIGFYDFPPDSRKLCTSSLETHKRDVQTVLDHFKDSYREIFISAHSLSGLVCLLMNPKGVKAMSFWDPSFDVTHFWTSNKLLKHLPEEKGYLLFYANTFFISEDMVEDNKRCPDAVCREKARDIKTPTQLVIPRPYSIFMFSPHTSPEIYRDALGGPSDLRYVDDALHVFANQGNREALFAHTLAWFEQHSSPKP